MSLMRVLAILLLLALGWGSSVSAQGEVPPVTPRAGSFLPSAADLGSDWQEISQAGSAPTPELFAEGVKAVYGGPDGSRALVYVWVTRDDTTTVGRSWDVTVDFLNSKLAQYASQFDAPAVQALQELEPPAGCAEAARAEGLDPDQNFPGGLTLCAVEPDVIIMTIVSGTLNADSGYLASDALVELALEARSD
jgi:hypothetical protein